MRASPRAVIRGKRVQGATTVGKNKKKSGRDDARKAGDARDRDAQREIARAEKRLAAALQELDDARAKLSRRETTLADLLRKHGRMPDDPQPQKPASVDNEAPEMLVDARADRADLALAKATDAQADAVRTQSESAFGLPGRALGER
jgi:hypothetical protein